MTGGGSRFQTGAALLLALPMAACGEPVPGGTWTVSAAALRVSAASVRVDPSTATVPWRVEVAADGARTMSFGHVGRHGLRPDTVVYAQSAGNSKSGSGEAAALRWSCNVHDREYDTVRDGRYLRSAYQVDCQGVDRHRVDWQFERSSWRDYQNYTHPFVGGWVSDVTNAQTVYADCGPGGTYDYRLGYNSVVVYQGKDEGKSPTAYSNKARSTCGTGVS